MTHFDELIRGEKVAFDVEVSTPIHKTPRYMQMSGLFDLHPDKRSSQSWHVELDLSEGWSIGAIIGPSGSGKSTIARALFGDLVSVSWDWPAACSILDGFPADMGINDIVGLLSSVGFASPPSWVRPFHVLSNGEQFRANMARTLAEQPELAVVDEFTSVVDRTVAKIGSSAIAKTVRRRKQRFVAVSCHYDILDWLEPDWVYQPHLGELERGRLWRRPTIVLDVARVDKAAWKLFKEHHYLSADLNPASACFCAFWNGRPVAFTAFIGFPHRAYPASKGGAMREHRTVCLPDFQGIGIGNRLVELVASCIVGRGKAVMSATPHPALIKSRIRSPLWKMHRPPSFSGQKAADPGIKGLQKSRAGTRLTAGFRYVGPAMERSEAERLWAKGG